MIKEALQYIVGLRKPEVIEVNGQNYCDKELERIEPVVIRETRATDLSTLTSFVDCVKARVERDKAYDYSNLYLHIINPTRVLAYEKANALDGYKTSICEAKAELPEIDYGKFYNSESFNILLQSRFCQDETTAKLLSIVGNVKSSDVQTKADNGITQTVQTSKGIVLKEDTPLPNPVTLAPFRTFIEIDQVASAFIFRARESKNPYADDDSKEINFALFEADGGAWKIEATQRIKMYLEEAFKDTGVVILA